MQISYRTKKETCSRHKMWLRLEKAHWEALLDSWKCLAKLLADEGIVTCNAWWYGNSTTHLDTVLLKLLETDDIRQVSLQVNNAIYWPRLHSLLKVEKISRNQGRINHSGHGSLEVSPLNPAKGLGEHYKLPQRGLRQSLAKIDFGAL